MQSVFLRTLTEKKVTIIYRRNKNEKKQKMCATLENTWIWIVRELRSFFVAGLKGEANKGYNYSVLYMK